MLTLITPSDARKLEVYENLLAGSAPRRAFFLLVGVSTLIAAFGLVMNSTAVVIGAMLVAPLMTPILGLGLGLVRGEIVLIATALRAEVLGVAVSLLAGTALGLLLPSSFEPTQEMLNRTNPNLFDLIVAVLAGLAGAYATVDEKISPVLPGVAISVAIVPPLANSGIALALGEYAGAMGSFLLFFANFLSILLISAVVYTLAGMSQILRSGTGTMLARRFGVALAGFVLTAALLSYELSKMFEDRRLRLEITRALNKEFADLRVSELESFAFDQDEEWLEILVNVSAPTVITPRDVAGLERGLGNAIGQPVRLMVRTRLTHQVSAAGTVAHISDPTLGGEIVSDERSPEVAKLQVAEQTVREYLEDKRGINLRDVRTMPMEGLTVFIAEVSGLRSLSAEEIGELEKIVRSRLEQTDVRVLVHQSLATLADRSGALRTEVTLPVPGSAKQQLRMQQLIDFCTEWLRSREFFVHTWSITILDGKYHMLLEVRGPRLFTLSRHRSLSDALADRFGEHIVVYVRSEQEAVLGPDGEHSLPELLSDFRRRNRVEYGRQIRQTVIESQ